MSEGVLLGNRDLGSEVIVANRVQKSFAGYAEILTGQALDSVIKDNTPIDLPVPTLLEVLKTRLGLSTEEVALFASWERFHHIAAKDVSQLVVNAGYDILTQLPDNKTIRALNRRQFEQLTPWTEVRHDYITCELALEYLRIKNPKVLYLGLGETDDWAHDKRYPRVVWAASYFDTCLKEVVEYLDESPIYRGKTLLVITTDHGRGRSAADWSEHKKKVPGSDEIWVYWRGPGFRVGVRSVVEHVLISVTLRPRFSSSSDNLPISFLGQMAAQSFHECRKCRDSILRQSDSDLPPGSFTGKIN